jgi:hypothetical protein
VLQRAQRDDAVRIALVSGALVPGKRLPPWLPA